MLESLDTLSCSTGVSATSGPSSMSCRNSSSAVIRFLSCMRKERVMKWAGWGRGKQGGTCTDTHTHTHTHTLSLSLSLSLSPSLSLSLSLSQTLSKPTTFSGTWWSILCSRSCPSSRSSSFFVAMLSGISLDFVFDAFLRGWFRIQAGNFQTSPTPQQKSCLPCTTKNKPALNSAAAHSSSKESRKSRIGRGTSLLACFETWMLLGKVRGNAQHEHQL